MADISLEKVGKRYGNFEAVRDLSLSVHDGEFLVLLGPSGCGKTTTLRMIAGFINPTHGTIRLGGRDITRLPPWQRNAGLVFQSYALFPHMTVRDNVGFGLEMRKMGGANIAARIDEALHLVRLDDLGDRLPRQLSGGQQQRVALARAIAIRPDVLLLDEPLSNLDAKLRLEVRIEIRALQRTLGLTTVMVTHDQEEALTMADRLVVMNDGAVRQVGSQRDLYERPADRFVAGFVGRSTFLDGAIDCSGRFCTSSGIVIQTKAAATQSAPAQSTSAVLAIRPERVSISAEAIDGVDNQFTGQVEAVYYLGPMLDVHVRVSPGDRIIAQIANRGESYLPSVGDSVTVGFPATAAIAFKGNSAVEYKR